MPTGLSLHIGLNSVDREHYQGWDGQLAACEFDAKDMLAIAKTKKFDSSQILLTKNATTDAVIGAIKEAAKKLSSGDLFWLTYSGHGGQVPDTNGDEDDGMDETWVLFDRMLIDDELYQLWSRFKSGVRILVLSDSCHSGTVTRNVPTFIKDRPAYRAMPRAVNDKVYKAHKRQYDRIQKDIPPAEESSLKSSMLLVSGCQDNQLSSDGARNGLFTQTLRKVWDGGSFKTSYRRFRDEIAAKMPEYQTPNYYFVGKANTAFEQQKPFTI